MAMVKVIIVSSRDTDNKKIRQFNWRRDNTGHTQPKIGTLRCYFQLNTNPIQKA